MRRFFHLMLAAGLLQTCGTESRQQIAEQTIQMIQIGQPKIPALADGQCQTGLERLGTYFLPFWNGFSLQHDFVDLSAWSSARTLASRLVYQTLYGYSEINQIGSQCEDRRRPSELMDPFCRDERRVQNSGVPLKICQELGNYGRSTAEGAALTLAASLSRVHQFYQDLPGSFELEPLMILLFPNIEYRTTFIITDNMRMSFSITDNAAWGRRGSRERTENVFYVFPMSQEYLASRKNTASPSFWEVPWIIAHEFGHHIFYNLLGPRARRYFGYDFFYSSQERELPYHYYWQEFKSAATDRESHQLTAINEAFSDLFAHYYREENSQEISRLDCIFYQRDVAVSDFNDGRAKSFTVLFDEPSSKLEPCRKVDRNDVHVQGSVFAYFFNAMLDLYPVAAERGMGDAWKIRIWHHAIQNLSMDLESSLEKDLSIEIWPMAVKALVDALLQRGMELNAAHCEKIDNTFGREFTSNTMSRHLDLACS